MKKSKIDKDIYKLSQTLYGAERYKLIIEAFRKAEKKGGEFNLKEIPDIDLMFKTKEEFEDFCKIYVDFFVVNEFLMTLLDKSVYLCLGMILRVTKSKNVENGVVFLLRLFRDFFDVIEVIHEINEKHGIDLVSYTMKLRLEVSIETMKDMQDRVVTAFEKVFGKKELKKLQELIEKFPHGEKERATLTFKILHQLINKCLYPS